MKTVLSPEQVAEVLGISRRTVVAWLQEGNSTVLRLATGGVLGKRTSTSY